MNLNEKKTLLRNAELEYRKGTPVMSDEAFDDLKREIDEETRMLTPDEPTTDFIDDGFESTFEKTTHSHPMLSLGKINKKEELEKWIDSNISTGINCSLKMDGFAISLVYTRKYNYTFSLARAVSRGDGLQGEDITENIKTIQDIPKEIQCPNFCETNRLIIRGEIYCKKSVFSDLLNLGLIPETSNIRNIAAGSCRNKDKTKTEERKLSFSAYRIISGYDRRLFSDDLYEIALLGFDVVRSKTIQTKEGILDFIKKIEEERDFLDFEIDGIVLRVNSNLAFDKMGSTSHHPNGAVAWKFESEKKTTILRGIEWNVGRSGILAPVALFDPIHLGGATVKRASLFNLTHIIDRLKLTMGATIMVAKNNDIIPYVVSVIAPGSTKIEFPKVCPSCENELIITKSESSGISNIYCMNDECVGKNKETLTNFCVGLGMKGINESIISTLISNKIISNMIDIFDLPSKVQQLLEIEGFSSKSIKNLITTIESARKTSIDKFILSLGIEGVGKEKSFLISNDIKRGGKSKESIKNYLFSGKINHISEIGFGNVVKENFISFMNKKTLMVSQLIDLFEFFDEDNSSSILGGKSFCITGTLSIKREELCSIITKNGGIVKSGISKDLNFLIVGDDAGSKKTKAESIGVQCIDEKYFFGLIGTNTESDKTEEGESEYENNDLF